MKRLRSQVDSVRAIPAGGDPPGRMRFSLHTCTICQPAPSWSSAHVMKTSCRAYVLSAFDGGSGGHSSRRFGCSPTRTALREITCSASSLLRKVRPPLPTRPLEDFIKFRTGRLHCWRRISYVEKTCSECAAPTYPRPRRGLRKMSEISKAGTLDSEDWRHCYAGKNCLLCRR